jgi:hypothetical protein
MSQVYRLKYPMRVICLKKVKRVKSFLITQAIPVFILFNVNVFLGVYSQFSASATALFAGLMFLLTFLLLVFFVVKDLLYCFRHFAKKEIKDGAYYLLFALTLMALVVTPFSEAVRAKAEDMSVNRLIGPRYKNIIEEADMLMVRCREQGGDPQHYGQRGVFQEGLDPAAGHMIAAGQAPAALSLLSKNASIEATGEYVKIYLYHGQGYDRGLRIIKVGLDKNKKDRATRFKRIYVFNEDDESVIVNE